MSKKNKLFFLTLFLLCHTSLETSAAVLADLKVLPGPKRDCAGHHIFRVEIANIFYKPDFV